MTTYAVADKVPEGCDYITAGKEYETEMIGRNYRFFTIVDDAGEIQICRWEESPHLNGGNWRRVEK